MSKCVGITGKGLPCKNKAKLEGFCGRHKAIPNVEKKTKSSLKRDENINTDKIVERLRYSDDILRKEFFKTFGKAINGVRKSGGSRGEHYDFEIYIRGEGWKKVEHKGSIKIKDFGDKPWTTGVQFYNGTGNIFSIGRKYAQNFYDRYINSGVVSKKYEIETPIPPYEIWEKAIFSQGNGSKIPFISELRKKTVECKSSRKGLYDERDEFTEIFNSEITDDDLDCLKREAGDMICKAMGEKDYWLQIHGDIDSDFKLKWTQNTSVGLISEIKVLKSTDCTYQLCCANGLNLQAKLRWGYNQGISNLRLDLK